MSYFINVILPIPLDKEFTYSINKAEATFLQPGMRVAVQFGKSKVYAALVTKIHQNPPLVYEAKEIEHILDESPIVTQHQLELWSWISSYYMCTKGEVMRAALPGAFLLESETIILKNEKSLFDESLLKDDEFLIYEALQYQSLLRIQEVMSIVSKKNVLPVIKRLIEKEVITVQEEIYEQYKPKIVRYIRLNTGYNKEESLRILLDTMTRAPKQREVLMHLFTLQAQTTKSIKVSDLVKASNSSAAVIRALVDKNILDEYHLQTDRVQYTGETTENTKQLNEYQHRAYEEIKSSFEDKDVCLFHGVTSSGKTEVYVKLIEQVIQKGEQVLYLLPEIALTTQLITRLQEYFGEKLTVYHSKYSVNERVEAWNNVKAKKSKAQVVIGARSAIFLPFVNLGLIIVDEEHENTFKQYDPAPRYHARDTAIVLAKMFCAKVVLGSATPAIETYYNARQKKYGLVQLTRRYGNVLMPEINLVDIKTKYKKKEMTGHFSDTLLTGIHDALKEGEQVILFQNRRGYSPVIECNTCGHSPQCPNCDVSLTFHSFRNQLRCHYCGHHIAMPQKCMACDSVDLTTKGFGTEQIENELQELFPDHKIGRMDQDTTRGKHGYEKIINSFEEGDIDIMVGTQMLSKGLDFRNVSLVGIMNADNLLNFPDFRAHERSFQLMQQVAGRAGRTKKRGKVLIQTYNPFHQILQQVSVNDYSGMYTDQIEERHQYKYPPFYKIIKITGKHKDYNRVNEATNWLARSLRNVFNENVLGPEFPPVSRIRNQYHKNIVIKIPQGQSLNKTKEVIKKINTSFKSVKEFSGVRVIINVDNY
ncbi:replication restart DNA helicase PriA [Aquimarina sp. MAR_2010_214]|uniref:replication restart helicase PriA n=1 Tax=Aquimarina sp. MAR_2010_214 TaxID=1250026 RepID=UPI000C704201|nr:primosomal protein N' [Aquimarina sp. MAR_2010_214]PKV50769.1 replication restart DNA helicase PriA [Aquimarina sp. MAR_2010_214]